MAKVSRSTASSSQDSKNEECFYLQDFSVWKQEYLSEDTRANLVAVTVINSLAIIPMILLNALVITAVATRERLRTKSNILVACLAGSDLMCALVAQPIGIAIELKRIFSDGPFCSLEKVFSVIMIGIAFISLGSLVLMGIDRFISIKHPLEYLTIVTTKRIKIGLLLTWVVGILVTIHELILAVIDSGTKMYFRYMKVAGVIQANLGAFYIGVIAYTCCYIFSETRRQSKRLKTEQLPQEETKRMKKENKAANTLIMILGTLALTYTPTIALALVIGGTSYGENLEPRIRSVLWSWILTISLLGPLLNPIIYFWRVKRLRHAILEIVRYRKPENSAPPIEMKVIKRQKLQVKPSTCEASYETIGGKQEQKPAFIKYCPQKAEEIIHIDETEVL